METQQSQKTETSMRERSLVARSSYLLGNRYCHYCFFRRKEVVDQRDNGSKMRGTIVQTETFFKSEIK